MESSKPEPSLDQNRDMDLTPRTSVDGTAVARGQKRNLVPIIVLALAIIAGGVVITQFLRSAVDYYCNVDEGSISAEQGITRFTISFNGVSLPVRYDGEPGGIFKECIPVVVHGVIENDELAGDRVEVKHSDEYVSVNDERVAGATDLGCDAPSIDV